MSWEFRCAKHRSDKSHWWDFEVEFESTLKRSHDLIYDFDVVFDKLIFCLIMISSTHSSIKNAIEFENIYITWSSIIVFLSLCSSYSLEINLIKKKINDEKVTESIDSFVLIELLFLLWFTFMFRASISSVVHYTHDNVNRYREDLNVFAQALKLSWSTSSYYSLWRDYVRKVSLLLRVCQRYKQKRSHCLQWARINENEIRLKCETNFMTL